MIHPASFIPRLTLLAGCLLVSACALEFSGWLPPVGWLPGWALLGALLVLPARLRPLGMGLMVSAALALSIHQALQIRLAPSLEDVPLVVEGTVSSLPSRQGFGDRVLFAVQACGPLDEAASLPGCEGLGQVSLSWGTPKSGAQDDADGPSADDVWPEPGQRWRLLVKLRRPVAAVNPDAFDTEQRMLQQGIGAVGRVVKRQRLQDEPAWQQGMAGLMVRVESVRAVLRQHLEMLQARIDPARGQDEGRWALMGIVTGLSLGDQAAMGAEQWGLFSRTGVSHLMAISGMHVTLLAMVVSAACLGLHRALARRASGRWLARLSRVPRQWLVLVPGVLTAFGYALLSGWGVPSQRTCFMLLAAAVLSVGGRSQNAVTPVLLAAAAIVALDPWSVAQAGFWLSFCAVLALVWCAQQPLGGGMEEGDVLCGTRWWQQGRVGQWWAALRDGARNQWAATVLLTPLTIAFFSTWSLIGPVANVLAIPWVGLVLTPMAIGVMLLAPVFPWLAGWLLKALLLQLGWLMAFLRSLDAWPLASVQLPRPGVFALVCALLGAVLMLAPVGLRRPRLGVMCLLPLLLASPRHAPPDALVVTALDIGQGSMIVVEQGEQRLLYDAGASRLGGRSAIDATLVPWLNSRGLNGVDVLVVSHLDAHHAGGAARAVVALNPSVLLTAMDPRLLGMSDSADGRFQPCLADTSLPWADGAIEVLQPKQMAHTTEDARQDQNSCVIRVRSSAGSVLLAGDLPARAEAALVKAQGDRLPADVLVVPQEGGRQGTGKQLLAAVQPTLAVVQTTHRNQHGRPDAALVERLENQGTRLLRTDRDGAVRIVLRQGQAPQVTRSRIDGAPYWRVRLDEGADGMGD